MYTCPCCGYEVFDEPPGSYSICPICFWEDDVVQLYFPLQSGGPNRASLVEAQVSFFQFGACERSMAKNVRQLTDDDRRDPMWFPLWEKRVSLPDREDDKSHSQHESSISKLCYWLRT
jgi:hypothetical protein